MDAVRTYDAHLAQTRGLHDAGLRTGIDVATAESAAASAEILLARARAAQEASRTQLLVALGEDRWHGWQLRASDAALEMQPGDDQRGRTPLDDLASRALGQRPEMAQLRLQQQAFSASVASARGGYLPALSLNLEPIWAGPSWSSLTGNLTVTIALGFPLEGMSPWLVHGQAREAAGNLTVARAGERASRDSIRQELADARTSFNYARDELRLARKLTEASARQRALAEGRYQTGVGNVIELYDALLTDVNARSQLVQARLDVAIGARAAAARAGRRGLSPLRGPGLRFSSRRHRRQIRPRRAARDGLYRLAAEEATMAIKQLNPYLNFNGTADKAIQLYQSALGAKVDNIMRFGDAAGDLPVAPADRNRVLHAKLQVGAACSCSATPCRTRRSAPTANVHITLDFDDVDDMTKKFDALAAGGKVTMPLSDTFWGARFGMLTDAYGIHWMFNCEKH